MIDKVINYWRTTSSRALRISIIAMCLAAGSNSAHSANNSDEIRTYQNTPHLTEEHKQTIADDISRFKQADNLWDVLRDEFSLPHYENNPLVQEKIEWFMNNQDFLLRSVTRASPYLYYILQQVKKRHLPAELVLLPIVESGYNPFATSNVGAAGIWQLMPGTASDLGVRQDWWYDGRRDVITSTHAALNYLAYLQSFFDGNWLLAIAAYNTGEGNVLAAIRRNISDGRDTDFWSLPVASQTKNYVPSILALAIIISKPQQYPIYFPAVRNAPYLAQFEVKNKINLRVAAALAGLSYSRIQQLNPGFTRAAAKGPYKLTLPIENVEQFSENLIRSPYNIRSSLGWIHYRMKAGDTLASVAKKFKTTPAEIRKLNHLVKSTPRRGTNLLLPDNSDKTTALASSDAMETKAPPSTLHKRSRESMASRLNKKLIEAEVSASPTYKLHPGDTVYMVRKNDSLDNIAKKFHITSKALITANKLQGRQLRPGKHLIIPTHDSEIKLTTAAKQRSVAPGETVYMVRRGDTIEKIANRFNTSSASIRIANMIDDSALVEGVHLVIPKPIES